MAAPNYDLTQTIAAHLDRHMILPLLEFIQEKQLYNNRDILQAKLELVSGTKMVDFAGDEYKRLHGTETVPKEMADQREQVYAQLEDWKEACLPLLEVLFNTEHVKQLRETSMFTMEYLKRENPKITDEMLGHLYRYAKLNYDCGRYRDAADYLFFFRLLSKDEDKLFAALWGKLAAEILMVNWESALEDLTALRDAVDNRPFASQTELLQQRTWILHWSLFIYFNVQDGRTLMLDFLFDENQMNSNLLNAIQMNCPHLLRYLTTAVITSKRRKNFLNMVVRVLEQERGNYTDPITEFVRSLYSDFDFELARDKLKESEVLISQDFFLSGIAQEFKEQARVLVFETMCRVHKRVDIDVLMKRLDLEEEKSERKLVDLIREARVDAKIDANDNTLVMGTNYPTIYQQVIDKTRDLSYRSTQIAAQVEKKYALLVEADE